jgi:hypothetical protein
LTRNKSSQTLEARLVIILLEIGEHHQLILKYFDPDFAYDPSTV